MNKVRIRKENETKSISSQDGTEIYTFDQNCAKVDTFNVKEVYKFYPTMVKTDTWIVDGDFRITNSDAVHEFVKAYYSMDDLMEEQLLILLLDTKLNAVGFNVVSMGTQNYTLFNLCAIFRRVLLSTTNCFILVHNHPSGDLTPSKEDLDVTTKLEEGAKLLGLRFVDHIIVGREGSISIKQMGL